MRFDAGADGTASTTPVVTGVVPELFPPVSVPELDPVEELDPEELPLDDPVELEPSFDPSLPIVPESVVEPEPVEVPVSEVGVVVPELDPVAGLEPDEPAPVVPVEVVPLLDSPSPDPPESVVEPEPVEFPVPVVGVVGSEPELVEEPESVEPLELLFDPPESVVEPEVVPVPEVGVVPEFEPDPVESPLLVVFPELELPFDPPESVVEPEPVELPVSPVVVEPELGPDFVVPVSAPESPPFSVEVPELPEVLEELPEVEPSPVEEVPESGSVVVPVVLPESAFDVVSLFVFDPVDVPEPDVTVLSVPEFPVSVPEVGVVLFEFPVLPPSVDPPDFESVAGVLPVGVLVVGWFPSDESPVDGSDPDVSPVVPTVVTGWVPAPPDDPSFGEPPVEVPDEPEVGSPVPESPVPGAGVTRIA